MRLIQAWTLLALCVMLHAAGMKALPDALLRTDRHPVLLVDSGSREGSEIFHYGEYSIGEVKKYLDERGVCVRL